MKNIVYVMSPIEGRPNLARSLMGAACLWHWQNHPFRGAELVVTGDFMTGTERDEETFRMLMTEPGHLGSLVPRLFERVDVLAGGAEFTFLYSDWRDGVAGACDRYCASLDLYHGDDEHVLWPDERCHEWLAQLQTSTTIGPFYVASSASEEGREYDQDWDEQEFDYHLAEITSRLEVVVGFYDEAIPIQRGRRLNISTGISRPDGALTVVALDPENLADPIVGVLRAPRVTGCPEFGDIKKCDLEFLNVAAYG